MTSGKSGGTVTCRLRLLAKALPLTAASTADRWPSPTRRARQLARDIGNDEAGRIGDKTDQIVGRQL